MPYIAWRQAGVTVVLQDDGTALLVKLASATTDLTLGKGIATTGLRLSDVGKLIKYSKFTFLSRAMENAGNIRDCGVHEVKVTLEGSRDRVLESADGVGVSRQVLERSELGIEERVGFLDSYIDLKPVACGRRLRGSQAVLG